MALLALVIYTHVRIVRPFVCANYVCVYTIERTYMRENICACNCIRVSLRLFTRKNANAFFYIGMRKFACQRLRACVCVRVFACALIKTQNAFARKIFLH